MLLSALWRIGGAALGSGVTFGVAVWLFVGSRLRCVPWRLAAVCSVQWRVHRGGGATCQISLALFVELELLCY